MEDKPSRAWHVFATYLAAVAGMLATGAVVFDLLRSAYPDVPDLALVQALPGLLGLSLANSASLLLTLALLVRPFDAARFRLLPGWETTATLAVMVLGLLALSQVFASATALVGPADRGSLDLIQRVLEQTRGPDLFAAVLVFGVGVGAAEEIFFRGYMQSRLREHWSPPAAVLASSSAFAVLHIDASAVLMVGAFALSLYLGFVAEISGSTLPAIVCHVVNNVVFTLQAALGFAALSRDANVTAAVVGGAVFVACLLWLRRVAPGPTLA